MKRFLGSGRWPHGMSLYRFRYDAQLPCRERFLEALFERRQPALPPTRTREQNIESVIARGGYPELVARDSSARREAWLSAYVTTLIERDVRDLANIEGLSDLPRVLGLLAARTGALLNVAEVSRDSSVAHEDRRKWEWGSPITSLSFQCRLAAAGAPQARHTSPYVFCPLLRRSTHTKRHRVRAPAALLGEGAQKSPPAPKAFSVPAPFEG